jgi:hypothetical protein
VVGFTADRSRSAISPSEAALRAGVADLSRRTIIKATGVLGVLPSNPTEAHAAQAAPPPAGSQPTASIIAPPATTYIFFNSEEAAFIEAAVARLIPADEEWPGALEARVPNYIDKQLAGAWGAGERLYRSGPWQADTPSQRYQLPYTPAELFRTALAAINKQLGSALVHFQTEGEIPPNSKLLCGDRLATDGIRASGRQHPIQRRHADGSLGLLSRKAAGSQPWSDQRLVTTHCRFY